MKEIKTDVGVDIQLRSLDERDRRMVQKWIDRLRNWVDDPSVRKRSRRLKELEDTYVLKADSDFRIFFKLNGDSIALLDIARLATIQAYGQVQDDQ